MYKFYTCKIFPKYILIDPMTLDSTKVRTERTYTLISEKQWILKIRVK